MEPMELDRIILKVMRENGPSVQIELSAHSTADEVMEAFKSFMLAAGYHPDTVADLDEDTPDEYEYEDDNDAEED